MIDYKTIKNDLIDIRFYYSRKNIFESGSQSIGENMIAEKARQYNEIIRYAPARLYEFYVSLYLQNNTLESLAYKLGYAYGSVQRINSQLIKYLRKELNKKEEQQNG